MSNWSRLLLLVSFLAISCWNSATAMSSPPRPLRRLAHPSTHAIDIFPRTTTHEKRSFPLDSTTLHHSDSFRLTLSAFGDTFHLHLRPNDELIHSSARINYYSPGPNGQAVLTRTEPLVRESVKAYWGHVIHGKHTDRRMREDSVGMLESTSSHELGWARITVHHQGDREAGVSPVFEGAFTVNGVVHHVMTKDNYLRTKHPLDPGIATPLDDMDSSLVIWRDTDVAPESSDIPTTPHTCGHDNLKPNVSPQLNPLFRTGPVPPPPWYDNLGLNNFISKRDDVAGGTPATNFIGSIGRPDGCPTTQKVLYMGVAADCMYTSRYGSTQNATTKILTNWNSASALYKSTFNVSLGLISLDIHDAVCPTQPDPAVLWNVDCSRVELSERLSLFSEWRGRKGDDGAGLWHLMSGCPTGTEVGIAWLGTMCEQRATGRSPSIVSGTAVSTAGRTEWQVIAHETGHNFGAVHDCTATCNSTSSCCPLNANVCDANARFLMSPTAEAGETSFSPCSLGNICSMMQGLGDGAATNTSCLQDPDPNRQTISLQMCGNGIVEKGEDCDPGLGVESACCDSATCKFRPGAVCDPASSPCCTRQCSFAPPTQICRPAKDAVCDSAERCTGTSSSCPTDNFSPNGQSCGGNGLACASGLCTSIAKQCQTVGAAMGLKAGCPNANDRSCQLSCQNPDIPNQCLRLQSQLVDGSPCGFGGTCFKGNCQSGDLLTTAKAWYTSNLQISIPITVVAGIVFLLLVVAFYRTIRGCCRRDRRLQAANEPALGGVRGERIRSYDVTPMAAQIDNHAPFPARMPSGPSRSYSPAPNQMIGGRSSPFPAHRGQNSWVDDQLYNGPRR